MNEILDLLSRYLKASTERQKMSQIGVEHRDRIYTIFSLTVDNNKLLFEASSKQSRLRF